MFWFFRRNYLAALLGVVGCICSMSMALASDDVLEHGRYVFYAAGCISCHTRDQLMAGGRPVVTPFGTFYPRVVKKLIRIVISAS
jgi:mono/diheme cytochrome c family protein